MRDQNHRLRSAIERLLDTTRGDEDPELLNTIFNVAEAAGIEAQRPAQRDNAHHDASGQPKRPSGPRRRLPAHPWEGADDLVIHPTTRDRTYQIGDQASLGSGSSDPSTASASAASAASAAAAAAAAPPQRLKCAFWLDHQHYMRISMPPDDIIPYLGAGSRTFAGILFWSMLDHSQNRCTRRHSGAGALSRKALAHSKVTEELATTYIQAMVEARQEYRRTGSISSKWAAAAEPDMGRLIRDRIHAEYQARGMDPDEWLSATGIENRLRSMVGDAFFAVLETAARGGGDPVLRASWETIECKLHDAGVCFGDGPRWHVDIVDELFLDWVYQGLWSTQDQAEDGEIDNISV